MEVFQQTVSITLVGMALTFTAIGVLVLAMILLTRLARGKDEAAEAGDPASVFGPADDPQALEQAAAAAVAYALARQERGRRGVVHGWHTAQAGDSPSAWQVQARARHFEQRRFHHASRQ
jgi:Na+-transporting methylmalonyl-CoA/oxaloacetate decarboxylase gamma subunit